MSMNTFAGSTTHTIRAHVSANEHRSLAPDRNAAADDRGSLRTIGDGDPSVTVWWERRW
jgi:hypothetical protein